MTDRNGEDPDPPEHLFIEPGMDPDHPDRGDDAGPVREPITTDPPVQAEVQADETCSDCGEELVRGEDEINVTSYGPGSDRAGERVVRCSDCKDRHSAENIAEHPDLAAMWTDQELRDLRERFPDILGDVDLDEYLELESEDVGGDQA